MITMGRLRVLRAVPFSIAVNLVLMVLLARFELPAKGFVAHTPPSTRRTLTHSLSATISSGAANKPRNGCHCRDIVGKAAALPPTSTAHEQSAASIYGNRRSSRCSTTTACPAAASSSAGTDEPTATTASPGRLHRTGGSRSAAAGSPAVVVEKMQGGGGARCSQKGPDGGKGLISSGFGNEIVPEEVIEVGEVETVQAPDGVEKEAVVEGGSLPYQVPVPLEWETGAAWSEFEDWLLQDTYSRYVIGSGKHVLWRRMVREVPELMERSPQEARQRWLRLTGRLNDRGHPVAGSPPLDAFYLQPPVLEEWEELAEGDGMGSFKGNVFGQPGLADGTAMTTAPVDVAGRRIQDQYVATQCGVVYELGERRRTDMVGEAQSKFLKIAPLTAVALATGFYALSLLSHHVQVEVFVI